MNKVLFKIIERETTSLAHDYEAEEICELESDEIGLTYFDENEYSLGQFKEHYDKLWNE